MRKATGILSLFAACSLLLILYNLHLGIGAYIRTSYLVGSASQEVEVWLEKIEIWLDKTPPTPPERLRIGRAPTIQLAASYYGSTHVVRHTMAPFDSSGGDLLVAYASTHQGVLLRPSDNFNNAWVSLAGPTTARTENDLRSQIWYASNPKVGPNYLFTVELSGQQALVISMFVVKGSNVLDPIDAFSAIGDDADTRTLTPTSPGIMTTHYDDLLIGFGKSWTPQVWTAGGGFAFQQAASSSFLVAEVGLAAAPGSYNSTFFLGARTNWQAAVVAVRPAAPPGTSQQLTIAWKPSSDNFRVIGYQVERCRGAECEDFARIGTTKDSLFVDSTLSMSAVYRYRVRAIDAASNTSEYSETISADFLARSWAPSTDRADAQFWIRSPSPILFRP